MKTMLQNSSTNSIVEALILASPEPLPAKKIAEIVEDLTPAKVGRAVSELNNRYLEAGSSYRVRELSGGFQFYLIPEFTGYVDELLTRRRKMRLTRASLETLAIIAYKQPVTKSTVEHIRGVASDGVIHNLLQKNMVSIKGRADTVGKPLQYGTGDEFLKFFGLNNLDDLPKMSEIEELITSREAENQTELELGGQNGDEAKFTKLNIADGTFDPDAELSEDDEKPERPESNEAQEQTEESIGVSADMDEAEKGE